MKHILTSYIFYVLLLIIVFTATFASAHKINVFAYESSNSIYCEATFSGGRPAQKTTIEIVNTDNHQLLLTGTTDELGKFSFPIQEEMKSNSINLLIVAESGDGHKNTWQLPAEDYLHSTKVSQTDNLSPQPPHKKISHTTTNSLTVDEQSVERMIEKVIQRELAPIKRNLAQRESAGPSAKDIFSGLGYIFGLAGLTILIRSKKKGEKNA